MVSLLQFELVGAAEGVLRVAGLFGLQAGRGLVILLRHLSVERDDWSVLLAVAGLAGLELCLWWAIGCF